MRVPLIAAAVLACLVAACGGDESSPVDFAVEAQRLVPSAVLMAGDVPGFELQDAGALEEQADLSPRCDIFDADLVFPDAVATAESEAFLGPLDSQAFNHVAIYRTEAEAGAAVAGTQAILGRCEEEFRDVVERIAKDELDELGIDTGFFSNIDVEIGNYEAPAVGDEALGYRMNVHVNLVVTDQQYNLDVIVFRVGRVVSAVMHGGFGEVRTQAETEVAEASAANLKAAEAELPGQDGPS